MILVRNILRSVFFGAAVLPGTVFASVQITEIMYDLEGVDGGFEWIEITNMGTVPVDVGFWRFFEANTNHKLTLSKGQSPVLLPGVSAIIADKPDNFLSHWPQVEIVFDSAFSLSNTGESLALKKGTEVIDQIAYTEDMGAKGDGGSLHRSGARFVAALPTPGIHPGELKPVPQTVSASKASATSATKSAEVYTSPEQRTTMLATPVAAEESSPLFPWVLGLISILGLGVTAVFLVRTNVSAIETFDPADEFTIIDKTEKTL